MKKIIYTLTTVLISSLVLAQTTTKNYIKSTTYQVGTVNGTINADTQTTLTDNDKLETLAYFDGLGRPMQNIGIKAGGNNEDIVTPIAYDNFGRQNKDYLPYAAASNGGMYRTDALTDTYIFYYTGKYENTNNPYSEKQFEASPISRVLKQAAPGASWALGSGHEIKLDYQNNTVNEVKYFKAVATWNATAGLYDIALVNGTGTVFYDANQLYKTITKDENWTSGNNNTVQEFKDKEGRLVLKRVFSDYIDINGNTTATQIAHDTYYVYDQYGNLTYVIPPKADGSITDTVLSELCYQYRYDYHNRLAEKKLPGKGTVTNWEEIVYNKLDQPILTRDPNLKAQSKWLFTKYDAFGRVAYTGLINNSSSRTTLQNAADGTSSQYVTKSATATTIAGTTIYYDNGAYPTVAVTDELHTINYYDDYGFDVNGASATGSYHAPITNAKGLATGSKVRVLGTTNWITNVNYYDAKGRSIYTYSKNDYLVTTNTINSKLDFPGKVLETTSTHLKNSVTTTVVDVFTYDQAGRLTKQTQAINGAATPEVIAENSYDELGQLFQKKVGGKTTQSRLQTVDYTYNIRGWLKGINDTDTSNATITLGSGDLFGFQISYNNPSTGTPLYNGNISQTFWKTANIDTGLKNYNYTYDALNRLTAATDKTSLTPNRYNESLSYDKNGNIMSLLRMGNTNVAATIFGTMDNLVYTYDAGNKLTKVEDSSGSTEGFNNGSNTPMEYTYDNNGNMTTDANKGITAISYNHLNLPTSVTLAGGTINYYYDATGVKQRKVAAGITTDYAGGFQYEGNILKFFPQPEGYVAYNSGTFSYIYQYKDHLGNVRLSYGDSNNDGSINSSSEIIEENNYYPFGLEHKGYNSNKVYGQGNATAQKYKYNGKELQDELGLNVYDYGFRLYDPAIGRMQNPDPLAELAYDLTPNRYCFNNPVNFIDPTGLWETTAGGYKTDKAEDIKRFMSYLDTENAVLNNSSPTFEQKSSFIEGEMSAGGHGKLSDGSTLADELTIVGTKRKGEDFKNGYADKSFQDFYHGVQRSLTPDALDTRTVGHNIFWLTYPGPWNPKTYAGDDDYSYVPKRPEEYPALAHDLGYDRLKIRGGGGLFTAKSASVTDYKFVTQELAIALSPAFSARSRFSAGVMGVGLGLAALPKTVLGTRSTESMDMQTQATIMGH